jgi:hypothetical protein
MEKAQVAANIGTVKHDNETTKVTERAEPKDKKERQPHRLNIPGFINEEVGLGDVFKRVTYAVGIKPCGGCHRRAATLNRWLAFTPRR